MNLTEPQCGTDLGLMRTRAVPQADGSYKITGTKIFISAGEHDLAENIIHLVLARIEGAPEGVKGISLFIVPKFLPDARTAASVRATRVSCGSIEEKMGIHGNATCVMNYDGATGWLMGEPNRGLQRDVRDDERGAAWRRRAGAGAVRGRLSERRQLRQRAARRARLTGAKFPHKPADPIIVHPDVRRMLMSMRAFNEAARALVLWTALKSDVAHRSEDAKERQAADDHMGLMTPVIKGVLTDQGFANTVMAQQVFGGHGYIAEHGMEQFVRDARIAMIYEGANGIQALDLVGRKLPQRWRPRACRRFSPRSPATSRTMAPTPAGALRHAAAARRSANCSRRPCGSCRMRLAIPTMPAPVRPIICISSAWSRSAICGA